jgi:hypothetical protein
MSRSPVNVGELHNIAAFKIGKTARHTSKAAHIA